MELTYLYLQPEKETHAQDVSLGLFIFSSLHNITFQHSFNKYLLGTYYMPHTH